MSQASSSPFCVLAGCKWPRLVPFEWKAMDKHVIRVWATENFQRPSIPIKQQTYLPFSLPPASRNTSSTKLSSPELTCSTVVRPCGSQASHRWSTPANDLSTKTSTSLTKAAMFVREASQHNQLHPTCHCQFDKAHSPFLSGLSLHPTMTPISKPTSFKPS